MKSSVSVTGFILDQCGLIWSAPQTGSGIAQPSQTIQGRTDMSSGWTAQTWRRPWKGIIYDNQDQLCCHLFDFLDAYNNARPLRTLSGLTPYEYICKTWTSEPEQVILNPIHQMLQLNNWADIFNKKCSGIYKPNLSYINRLLELDRKKNGAIYWFEAFRARLSW